MALFPNIGGTIKSTVRSARNEVSANFKGTVQQAKNEVHNTVRGTVMGVAGAGVNGVNNAMSSVMRGDIVGAVDHIARIPGDAFGTIDRVLGGAFGITSGSTLTGAGSGAGSSSGTFDSYSPIQGAIARGDPMLSFNWYAHPPVLETPYGVKSLGWNYVEEVTIPFRTKTVNSIHREGAMKHYASGYTLDNLRVNFFMDEGNKSLDYLQAWDATTIMPISRETYSTSRGLIGLPYKYKKDFDIYLVNASRQTLVKITYIGAWIESIDSLGLTSSTSDRLVLSASFKVDDVIIDTFSIDTDLAVQVINSSNPIRNFAQMAQGALDRLRSGAQNAVRGVASGVISFL